MTRAILHVDMDAFYASVEQLDDPSLRGRPVLVGHDGPRGVVAAASYEARKFGCHSAQPIVQAKRCCPHAIIVPGRGSRYREVSDQVFGILRDTTPLVQPLSIDEAFLDVTGSRRLLGPPREIAVAIKRRVRDETGLTASVGVAWNMFLAKLASDWDKPDGLTVITPEDIPTRVAALPIRKMWGVGPATERRLARLNIRTFGDLQALPADEVRRRLGEAGEHFRCLALGDDQRPVTADGGAKSIGNERTFGADVREPDHVRQVLLGQCEHVAMRMRRSGVTARTVTVKIRFGDFETISRSTTIDPATDETGRVWHAARTLFDRWADGGYRPVRLVGVSASNLEPAGRGQMDLFVDGDVARRHAIDEATDAIRRRYGRAGIGRGIPYTAGPSDEDPFVTP